MSRKAIAIALALAGGMAISANAYPAAAISIEKSGADYYGSGGYVDADTESEALVVETGATLAYFFVVYNEGDITLSNVTLTDAALGISLNIGTLSAGTNFAYSGVLDTAIEGLNFNIASVTGIYVENLESQVVTDSDAFYYRASSQIPEPATLALFSLGLAGLGAIRRRKLVH